MRELGDDIEILPIADFAEAFYGGVEDFSAAGGGDFGGGAGEGLQAIAKKIGELTAGEVFDAGDGGCCGVAIEGGDGLGDWGLREVGVRWLGDGGLAVDVVFLLAIGIFGFELVDDGRGREWFAFEIGGGVGDKEAFGGAMQAGIDFLLLIELAGGGGDGERDSILF